MLFTYEKVLKLLRYNWKYLYKATKGDCSRILSVLKALSGLKSPSQRDKRAIRQMLNGDLDGWILNAEWLLNHKESTNSEKCVYVYLASKRNYMDYLTASRRGLPLFVVLGEFDENKLKNNCLLTIDKNIIYFEGEL